MAYGHGHTCIEFIFRGFPLPHQEFAFPSFNMALPPSPLQLLALGIYPSGVVLLWTKILK